MSGHKFDGSPRLRTGATGPKRCTEAEPCPERDELAFFGRTIEQGDEPDHFVLFMRSEDPSFLQANYVHFCPWCGCRLQLPVPKIWRLFLLYQKADVHRALLFERSQREGLKIPEDSYASFDGYQFYRPRDEHCGPSWGSLGEDPPQNEDLGKRLLRLERRYRQATAWSGRIADALQEISGSSRFAYQYNGRIVAFTIANRSLDFIDVQLLKDI